MCQLEADLRNNLRTTPLGSSWGPKPYSTSLVSNGVQDEWYASGLYMGHSGWLSASCGLLSGSWLFLNLPFTQPLLMGSQGHWWLVQNVVASGKQEGLQWLSMSGVLLIYWAVPPTSHVVLWWKLPLSRIFDFTLLQKPATKNCPFYLFVPSSPNEFWR